MSTRPCSGRRAVAVLREASRPHLILYSRRLFTGLDGSRGGSTFVQRGGGLWGKRQGMRALRLATNVKLASALLSWSGARQARRSMASGMGTEPGEPVTVQFAITESLVGAHIAPHVHLGAGLVIFQASRHTVTAQVEVDESERGSSASRFASPSCGGR